MFKPLAHFRTITRHRHEVIKNCYKAGIGWQGQFHDLSKYSLVEFIPGARYYQGTRSPNTGEREAIGYSKAWLHHKGRNKHHYEYWMDYIPGTRTYGPVQMPMRYVAEMFCDRLAASKIYQGKNFTNAHPLQYFLGGKPTRVIHPETSDTLEHFLTVLAKQGEDAAFAEIRRYLAADKALRKENKHV